MRSLRSAMQSAEKRQRPFDVYLYQLKSLKLGLHMTKNETPN